MSATKIEEKLVEKPVLLLVGTGCERLFRISIEKELKKSHRNVAIQLMLEAQKKGFQVVCTDKRSYFLEKAAKNGVNIAKIIFLSGEHFGTANFYNKLHENGICPSMIITAGHFRDSCERDAIKNLSTIPQTGKGQRIMYVIGTASAPKSGYMNKLRIKSFSKMHHKGLQPVTIQEVRAMDAKGTVRMPEQDLKQINLARRSYKMKMVTTDKKKIWPGNIIEGKAKRLQRMLRRKAC